MMLAPGYLGAIAAKGPISLTVPSMITTAPDGITPDLPRRGSVMAYAPRIMIVSVISSHPRDLAQRLTCRGQVDEPSKACPRMTLRGVRIARVMIDVHRRRSETRP